jgi:DNA-binding Lrp family transcriptional regulator
MNRQFSMIPAKMLDDERLRPLDILVYAGLDSFAGSEGEAWPSLHSIAERAKVSPATVKRALERLHRAGYIIRQRRRKAGTKEFDSTFYKLPFRCGEVSSEAGSGKTGVGSPEYDRSAPSVQEVGSESSSNHNHRTITNEPDCAGFSPAQSEHTAMVFSMFEELWERYPRKSCKGNAKKKFMALFPTELSREARNKRLSAINERFLLFEKECEERIARCEERYIPYLHRWLDGEDFTDV